MIRRLALLACLLLSAALSAADGAWVAPVSWSDPEGKWVDVPLSWDGSTASYAADQSNRAGDGPWLELAFAGAIRTDRVLINADFGFGIVDAVDLEARGADGTWTRLHHGAVANCADDIVVFPALTTDTIRFRFHYLTAGYYFWLYQIAAFALPPSVELPQVATGAATSVTASTAALHGTIASDGGEPCAYRFRYHALGSEAWTETPWGGAAVSGQGGSSVLLPVTGLQAGTTYAYHIQARNSVGVATGADVAFTPQPVALGSVEWLAASDVAAVGANGMAWETSVNALDDDAGTAARCYHPLWAAQWGPDLTFSLPAVEIDHVRLSAGVNPYIDAVAVEVRASVDAAWTPLYQGAFQDRTWLVLPLPARATYAQARVRFHVTTTGVGTNWELYEFQVRMPPLLSFASGADRTATEPGQLALPLRLQPATSTLPITVDLAAGGTALVDTDWRLVASQVVIPAGAPAGSVAVEVLAGTGSGTATVTLAQAGAARLAEPLTAAVTIQRDGGGGGGDDVPPAVPGVALAITGGLSGAEHASIDGVDTALTRHQQITVTITPTIADGADLVGTQLVASAGTAVATGATTWTLSDLPEGRIDLGATVTVRKNGQEATGSAAAPLALLVDRTAPSVLLCEPGSTDGSAPLGVGLVADGAMPLLLNLADDAAALRAGAGWRCWNVTGLAIPARISDASGLSTAALPQATVGTAALAVTPASLDSATMLATLTGFAGLPESLLPDDGLVLGAGAGLQPLHLRVEDRCGNALDADLCSVWKKTTAGGARFGYIPRTPGGFATGIGVIADNGPTDQAPAQLLATAADIVAVECQGTALRRLSASPTSWSGLGGATPVLWRLSPGIAADALDHLAVTVTLRDLAGNRQEAVARATQTWFDAVRPAASRQILADPVTVPQQYAVRILGREMEFPYFVGDGRCAVLKTYTYDAVGEVAQPLVETRWQIRPVGWTLRENPLDGSRIGIEYERSDEASTIVRASLAGGAGTLAGGLDAGLPQYAVGRGHDGSSSVDVNPEQDYDWGMMGSGWLEWYTTTPWHATTAPVSEPVYGLTGTRPVAGTADWPHLTGNTPVMSHEMLTWTTGEEGMLASYMSGGPWLQWIQWMRVLDRQIWTVAADLDSARDHWNTVEGALRCVTLPSSWATPAPVAYPVPATAGRWTGSDGTGRDLGAAGDGLDLGLRHADAAGFARVQWQGTGTDGEPRRQQLGFRAIDAVGIPQDVIAVGPGMRCAIDGGFVAGPGASATVALPSGSSVSFGDAAVRAVAETALRGQSASGFAVWCSGEAVRLAGIARGTDPLPAWAARVLLPARGLMAVATTAAGAPAAVEQALRTADATAPDQALYRSAVDLDALTAAATAAQTAATAWQTTLDTLRSQQEAGTAWDEAAVTAAVAAAGQAATTRSACLAQGQAAWAAYRQAVAAALQPYETELAACAAEMQDMEDQSLAYALTVMPWYLSQFEPNASGTATGWAEINPEWAYAWYMAGQRRSEILNDPAYVKLTQAKQQAAADLLAAFDRTADPTLCDHYADRTWRTGDLALPGLLRVTGLSLTAEALSAPLKQTLVCDLEPGTAAVGVYDVLVRCGMVHAYPDELSQQYAGANGAHRMKEALQIIAVNLQEQKRNDDGTVDTSTWENNFTIEQSKPVVRITSPYDGQSMPDATSSDGSRQVAVSGTVRDIGAEITGQPPTLAINGTVVALSGSNGNYSFSSTVTVAADGLITARATDAWGNVGADESVIARTYTAPPDAVRPANPPETTDVLNGPHGYVFAKNRYSLVVVGAGRELTATDVVTGQVTVVSLAAAGSITTTDRDDAPLVIPVFASADGLWWLEEESRVAGTASQRGSVNVTVVRTGNRETRALIETAPASGVFVTQAAEVTLMASVPLTDTVADTLHAVIYRPFMPRIVVDVVETGPATHVFTGGGVTVEMTTAAGCGSPVSVVTAPALGLAGMPVLTTDPEETWESGALVTQSSTPVEGGPSSGDSYSDASKTLPMARLLPDPRAKRITMKLPSATTATVTVKVTTDQGTTHDVVLTRNGDEYQSEPLFYEVGAIGARAMGGFPVRFEVAGGSGGGTSGGGSGGGGDPPPVVVQQDLGGDVVVEVKSDAGVRKEVVVRRIPDNSNDPGSHVVREGDSLSGGAVVHIVSGVVGGANLSNRRNWSMRLDESQWKYLNFESEAAVATNAAVEATRALQEQEAAAARAAMSQYRGGGDGGWTFVGPRNLGDLGQFSKGFAVGTGQQLNETINPWEIIKGMAQLVAFVATTDFSQIDGGELFKKVLLGHVDDMQTALLHGNFYEAGIASGRFFLFYVSIPVAADVLPAALGRLQRVMVQVRVTCPMLATTGEVVLRSTLIIDQLVRLEFRIQPARLNMVLNRAEGSAKVYANKKLVESDLGEAAQQIDFPSVRSDRFKRSWPTNTAELERGHLIPKRFGGKGDRQNLVPMYRNVNQRLVKEVEDFAAGLVKEGKEVEYSILPRYGAHPSIPEKLVCVVKVDGKVKLFREIDNVP